MRGIFKFGFCMHVVCGWTIKETSKHDKRVQFASNHTQNTHKIRYITKQHHKGTVSKMVTKKKREELILKLLHEHNQLTLNQIHQELPQNTKKQLYNALKSLFEKGQITTRIQKIDDKPATTYQLTDKS